jgi:pyridoxine kinase
MCEQCPRHPEPDQRAIYARYRGDTHMPLAVILSSYVAASRVGGAAQALALAALGIDPVVVPTVLYGRHPGRGAPGGGVVPIVTFDGMLAGVEADGGFARADLVITGYFADAAQVRSAARAIDAARARRPNVRVIVDPIMGDAGRLYVAAEVADAVASALVPRADLVAPNAWELARLSGLPVTDPASAVTAARSLGKPVLVSSVPYGEAIGVVYADDRNAWLASHSRAASAPHGVGDLLTALFAAALIEGLAADQAVARAVGGVAEAVLAAKDDELPIVAMGARLGQVSATVRVERLS